MRTEPIPIHRIVLPEHLHRVDIDEQKLLELVEDIKANGLINAISVTELGDTYRLEAGHRRLLAHHRLARATIRATIYEPADQVNGTAVRFAENFHRADLSPMEEARALELALRDLKMPTQDLARMVGRSHAWVEQRLSLLGLPDELAEPVHEKRLGIAAALELHKVEDDQHRAYLLRYALDAGATTQTVRDWVNQWLLARAAGQAASAPRPEMPVAGQPVIIQIPCYVCSTPHAHEHMRILRVCPSCTAALTGVGRPDEHEQPSPATAATIPNAN